MQSIMQKQEYSQMRKFRTITLMALLVVMLVASIQPLGAQSASVELPAYTGGPAEIRMGWWGNDDRAARTLAVIELFQAAYPDITVIGEPNGGTPDHFQIIDTQLAGNNAPDIIQFGGNWPRLPAVP
jgi:ABC-type glycerol-3-phosphate transport system substrate-binding protein